ncbi:MAG: malto-oligosyltrehalose trehalohydrolase, partial [Mobilicoccus sp.]|nr:malto-oligosyltrehalose trehalohydrolase [Mobilicoccus sp.]
MSTVTSIAAAGTRRGDLREFTVWAPHATDRVDIDLDGERHAMEPLAGGWWTIRRPAQVGSRYGYSLD